MKNPFIIAATCVAVVASMAITTPALAGDRGGSSAGKPVMPGTPSTLTSDLVTPLSLSVDRRGTSYVSQNFAGVLTKVDTKGAASVIASAPGFEIGAVSNRDGTVYYAQNAMDHSSSVLLSLTDGGAPAQVADIYAYEASENPDQINSYGFDGLDQSCLDQFPTGPMTNPGSYTGVIDTHAYASLALDDAIYVADAGGNTILTVDYDGTISTTAVLPPSEPTLITADMAAAAGFPACSADHNYRFEPVPTDVELGPDGLLYVTSLPGGPEDASLGARGAVYTVDPDSGDVELYATGFVGATGLAVSPKSGTVYVAEMFGGASGTGQVSVVPAGASTPTPLIALTSPAAIELRKGSLYVTTDAVEPDATGKPIGTITVVPLRGSAQGDDCDDTTGHGNHGGNGNGNSGHGQNGHTDSGSTTSWQGGGHR